MSKALTVKERQRIASQNRVRSTMFLPSDIDLNEVDWIPSKEEKQARQAELHRQAMLKRLARWKQRWDEAEAADRRRRIRASEAAIAADRRWIDAYEEKERRQMTADEELKRIQDWYASDHYKELLACAKKAGREINRDICKTERAVLEKRGLVRGKRA